MLRRWLLVLLVAGLAAGAGVLAPGRPLVGAALAGLAGLGLGLALARLGTGPRRMRTGPRRPGAGPGPLGRLRGRRDRTGAGRVERLLDTLPTAVLLFTPAGLAYANPAARELFALEGDRARSPEQALGVRGLADAVTEAAETGAGVEVEVERDERELLARASATAGGEVALVVTDLTTIRRVERIRRDFVTNASHELKTPVAGIQALSESLDLALETDPARAATMVLGLQREAERLGQLVRDLLDLARLEEAAGEAARQRVDVAEMVRTQAERLSAVAGERGIVLTCDCPEPAPVVAVPHDLRLVVANLLENAVRYNREGGQVRARVRRDGATVELQVSDTGPGIPEADRERVFERFYRVDKGRSRLEGGTGLGLAIVRHAVTGHGGSIRVDSELGSGSTFTVTLPVEGLD